MATQSLYRRYRPRRFSEVKGQDHVVMALRNAVINQREGQAYLFSGPRGTGKTTSARILAKVLNCESPVDGEPCCQCDSCRAVEAGTSYDVHELDAASNNGVDAMRDLIEKASLGTPGRHKVYILDEVHMLSKAAEAALLKTLEEPPPHVVFVLATTDPQKVSDTIRSRTQHLQFHLLPADELETHVRWVAHDAGLELSDDALRAVLRQGGGSARDTLSALELAAATGGAVEEGTPLDDFVEALVDGDTGRALTAIARSVQQGRDPRGLAEDVVRHLRDCFLSLMAPEVVQAPAERLAQIAEQSQRLGAAAIVRAMEVLGTVLVEMRHAPDPRLLVEVAFVRLTRPQLDSNIDTLASRVEHLERLVRDGSVSGAATTGPTSSVRTATVAPAPAAAPPPGGRAKLGARAGRDATGGLVRPTAPAAATPAATPTPVAAPPAESAEPAPSGQARPEDAAPRQAEPPAAVGDTPMSVPAVDAIPAAHAAPVGADEALRRLGEVWSEQVLPSLKPIVRALYSSFSTLGVSDGAFVLGVSNDATVQRAEKDRAAVEGAAAAAVGAPVRIALVVAKSAADRPAATRAQSDPDRDPDESAIIDHSQLSDVPPESVVSSVDMLADAFPGSVLTEADD